jgi:anti-anti-sigma factor
MPDTDFYIEAKVIVATAIPGDVGIISKEAHQALDAMGPGEGSLIIDLSNLSLLPGSTSLQTLMRIKNKVRKQGGKVVLCAVPPHMLSVFRVIQLDRIFHFAPTIEDAVSYLSHQGGRAGSVPETDRLRTHPSNDTVNKDIHDNFEGYGRLSEPEKEPPPKRPTSPEGTRAEYLDALLATVPKDAGYEELVPKLASLSHEFRQQVAARFEPVLNAYIRAMPHDDLDGKKKVAEFVNSELERFGLAVKCPNTGLPAKLKASTGNWPGVGRFHFEVYIDGKREKPAVSDTLPKLELIDATPAIEPETPWQERVGPKSSRRGRKLS